MAAQYHNTLTVPLPPGWGRAVLLERALVQDYPCRSYDALGSGLGWIPPDNSLRYACDVEVASDTCTWLAKSCSIPEESFLRCWTLAEVVAKVTSTPILCLLKQGILRDLFEESRCGDEITFSYSGLSLKLLHIEVKSCARHFAFGGIWEALEVAQAD